MHANRQPFCYDTPAPAARLGGIGRVHGDDLNTGAFSLVFKHLAEKSKPCVMRGQGQVSVPVHEAEGKVLNRNQVVLHNQPSADLVQGVCSFSINR